jgi:hypothetical protein
VIRTGEFVRPTLPATAIRRRIAGDAITVVIPRNSSKRGSGAARFSERIRKA